MSQSEKFYAEYSKIRDDLKRQFIPKKEEYDEILKVLTEEQHNVQKDESKLKTYRNWKYRYVIINLKIFLIKNIVKEKITMNLFVKIIKCHGSLSCSNKYKILYQKKLFCFQSFKNIYLIFCEYSHNSLNKNRFLIAFNLFFSNL